MEWANSNSFSQYLLGNQTNQLFDWFLLGKALELFFSMFLILFLLNHFLKGGQTKTMPPKDWAPLGQTPCPVDQQEKNQSELEY